MAPLFRCLLLVFVIVAVACRRDVSRLDDVQKMAYAVKPAVVRISAYATAQFHYPPASLDAIASGVGLPRRDGTAAGVVETGAGGSGSGFIIHPDGWILTSGHVIARTRDTPALEKELLRNGAISALLKHFPVDDLRRLYRSDALERHIVALAAEGTVDQIAIVNEVELSNGEKMPFRVERYSPALSERGADLALLRVTRKNLPSLQLGDSDSVRVGDSVWSIGYPEVASSTDDVIGGWLSRESDLEATLSNGTITAIKHDITNTQVFQSNVGIYRGNSGGPAVNREGDVIGISTWGHTDAEQIKFLVPIDVAKKFLSEARVAYSPLAEGAQRRRWRQLEPGQPRADAGGSVVSELARPDPLSTRYRTRDAIDADLATPPGRGHRNRCRCAGRDRGADRSLHGPALADSQGGADGENGRDDDCSRRARAYGIGRTWHPAAAGTLHNPQRFPRRRAPRPRRLGNPHRAGINDL